MHSSITSFFFCDYLALLSAGSCCLGVGWGGGVGVGLLPADVLAGICKLWIIKWKESIIHSKNECGSPGLGELSCIYGNDFQRGGKTESGKWREGRGKNTSAKKAPLSLPSHPQPKPHLCSSSISGRSRKHILNLQGAVWFPLNTPVCGRSRAAAEWRASARPRRGALRGPLSNRK